MDPKDIQNPEDGTIVEVFPGVFYQYHEKENSWIRINGYGSIKTATQIEPGLMTKEDFTKIDTLLTSPPKTTLTSDQCNTTFDGGVIKLYSKDKSLFVEDYLDLYETGNTTREQWHIHEDTWGFNFKVNLQFLVEEMKKRGNLISETIVGPKGPPGDRGEPGIDKLDTGPRGEPGENGSNAPFDGGIVNTSNLVIKDKTRAVVHIETEQVSPDENYLVVHKGVISPEKLCTNKVYVDNNQSTWILVRNKQGIVCSEGCISSISCEDETAFLDIEIVVNSIKEHTNSLILKLKEEKEAQVREWLRTMMKVFNDQKYALCCGLENCRSRKRNQDERRYIESQRIAAAAADFNLIISGSRDGENVPEPHTKVELDLDEFKSCEGPGWIPTVVTPVFPPNPNDPGGGGGSPEALDLLVMVFVNNVYGTYRNGLNGGVDDYGQFWNQDISEYDNAVANYTGKFKAIVYNEGGGISRSLTPSLNIDQFQELENGREDLIMTVVPFDEIRGSRPEEPMFKPEDISESVNKQFYIDLLEEWYAKLEIFRNSFGYGYEGPGDQYPIWVPYFNAYEIPEFYEGRSEGAHVSINANTSEFRRGALDSSSSSSNFGQLCTTFERFVSEYGNGVWPKKIIMIWDDSKNVGLNPETNWIRNGINGNHRNGPYQPSGPFHEFKTIISKYTTLEEKEYKNERWLHWIAREL